MSQSAAGLADVVANDSFIVKTGSVTVEVPAIDAALLKARTAIIGLGGYISGSDQANQGDQQLASVTYRIPAARWEEAIDAIRALATKVVAVKTGTTEVTGQVIDLGARIDNLKATEQALQAIMVKAIKIQDILDVQNQLTGVRGQIEELTTEQTHLKDQAALSTLTVLFQTPIVAAVKETSKGWDPATEFDRAASQLLGLGQGVATAGIWFAIVVLPILVVAGDTPRVPRGHPPAHRLAADPTAVRTARRSGIGPARADPARLPRPSGSLARPPAIGRSAGAGSPATDLVPRLATAATEVPSGPQVPDPAATGRQAAAVFAAMKPSTWCQASAAAAACSSYLRSKKECGASG